MTTWRRMLPLVAWLGALAVGLAVFHGLGSGPIAGPPLLEPGAWGDWASARDPLVATVAILRLGVLALAWYLVGVTTIGLVARLLRAARLVRLADALTVPMVRRLLQGALGVGLATAMVGAATVPAGGLGPRDTTPDTDTATVVADPDATGEAATSEASVRMVGDAGDPAHDELTMRALGQESPTATIRALDAELDAASDDGVTLRTLQADGHGGEVTLRALDGGTAAQALAQAEDDSDAPGWHEVRDGESLWSIAHDALADAWDRAPTDSEVHDYWEQVIEDNRADLPDPDNPDLIFPGDEIALPDVAQEG